MPLLSAGSYVAPSESLLETAPMMLVATECTAEVTPPIILGLVVVVAAAAPLIPPTDTPTVAAAAGAPPAAAPLHVPSPLQVEPAGQAVPPLQHV
jgi:hypothetical protein